jgi:hypothetical protein
VVEVEGEVVEVVEVEEWRSVGGEEEEVKEVERWRWWRWWRWWILVVTGGGGENWRGHPCEDSQTTDLLLPRCRRPDAWEPFCTRSCLPGRH